MKKFMADPQGSNTESGEQATQLVPITELRSTITQIVREVMPEGKRGSEGKENPPPDKGTCEMARRNL